MFGSGGDDGPAGVRRVDQSGLTISSHDHAQEAFQLSEDQPGPTLLLIDRNWNLERFLIMIRVLMNEELIVHDAQ